MNKLTFIILALVGITVIAFAFYSNKSSNRLVTPNDVNIESQTNSNNLAVGSPNNVLEVDDEKAELDKPTFNQAMEGNLTAEQKLNMPQPKMILEEGKNYKVVLKTSEGDISINLNQDKTPNTVNNFVYLSKAGFYENIIFHRVISGFMIQSGDPKGNGTGGPGYQFNDEPFEGEYKRGTVAMANAGPNTNGSQFFIMHKDNPLPPNYVIFGEVTEGLDVVDKIATSETTDSGMGENSKPVNPVTIESVEVVEE